MEERVERFEVGDRVDSDHAPISVTCKTKAEDKVQGTKKKRGKNSGKARMRIVFDWSDEAIAEFKEKTENLAAREEVAGKVSSIEDR